MAKSKPPIKKKYIETPERMWGYFEEYRAITKASPRIRVDYAGKDGDTKKTPLETPLTIEGFRNYCRKVVGEVHQYFDNYEGRYESYLEVCRAIKDEIRQDQIEGGMVGMYNPSITQRLNGLVEKTESTIIEQPLFPDDSKKK